MPDSRHESPVFLEVDRTSEGDDGFAIEATLADRALDPLAPDGTGVPFGLHTLSLVVRRAGSDAVVATREGIGVTAGCETHVAVRIPGADGSATMEPRVECHDPISRLSRIAPPSSQVPDALEAPAVRAWVSARLRETDNVLSAARDALDLARGTRDVISRVAIDDRAEQISARRAALATIADGPTPLRRPRSSRTGSRMRRFCSPRSPD